MAPNQGTLLKPSTGTSPSPTVPFLLKQNLSPNRKKSIFEIIG